MSVNLEQSGGGSGGTTLTGTGLARNTGACTELSGAVTTSGSNVTTLSNLDASKITTGVLAPARGGVAPSPGSVGYFIPDGFNLAASEATTTIGVNAIRICPFLVSQTVGPFTSIAIRQISIATAANGSHYVSIFDSTGALVVAGKVACSGTGAATATMTVSSTTLVPGLYFIAWGTDCTNTVTWASTANSANSKFALLPTPKVMGFLASQISGGAMATSITVSAFTSQQAQCIIAVVF